MKNIIVMPTSIIEKYGIFDFLGLSIVYAELIAGRNDDGTYKIYKSRYSDLSDAISEQDFRILVTENYIYGNN